MTPAQLAELDRTMCELDDLRPRAVVTASAWASENFLLRDAVRPPIPTITTTNNETEI